MTQVIIRWVLSANEICPDPLYSSLWVKQLYFFARIWSADQGCGKTIEKRRVAKQGNSTWIERISTISNLLLYIYISRSNDMYTEIGSKIFKEKIIYFCDTKKSWDSFSRSTKLLFPTLLLLDLDFIFGGLSFLDWSIQLGKIQRLVYWF